MCLESLPEITKRLAGIEAEYTLSNAPERPTATLQITLARCVLLVAIRAVPSVAVTFHGQTPVHAMYNQVDPATGDLELGNHTVTSPGDTQEHVEFEPTLEGVGLVAWLTMNLESQSLELR